jgi:superfamily I DNA/RNA helicase
VADPWKRARRLARTYRAQLALDGAGSDALLDAAIAAEGLKLRPRPAGDALLFGALAVLDPEAKTIWLQAGLPDPERRLILAHEIGHCRLHHAPEDCRCDDTDLDDAEAGGLPAGYGPRQRRETEANAFAREFLLPVDDARARFAAGDDAHALARRLGLPRALVFAQLSVPDSGDEEPVFTTTAGAELDPSQEAAARAEVGPLLVGAGPGTGKTRTLTARVLYLTRECAVPAQNLLALTFSRKAAEEMRERIGGEDEIVAARAAITTFHGYGLDLLRRHYRAAGLPPRPILLTEAEGFALLERRIAALDLSALGYLHDPAFPLPDVLRAIARAKEEGTRPDALAQRAQAAGEPRWRDVALIYEEYEALLAGSGALDFADLIIRPLRLLESQPEILDAERRQWRHILVDEYQDINRAGAHLVRLLSGPDGAGLWAVGDLRQAIYAFRGASPANVSRFAQDFPSGKRLDLAVNYRSRPELVALFGRASGEAGEPWQARRDGPASATIALADDEPAQADGIAAAMRRFAADGYAWREMAGLCRTRGQVRALRAALLAREIPVAPGPDEGGLLARPEVRRLVALLARIAYGPESPGARLWPQVPAGLDPVPGRGAQELLAEALWGPSALARVPGDGAAIAQLLALARGFAERAPVLLSDGDDPLRGFLDHLRRLARLGVPLGAADPESAPDAVRLMTVHAAKGLEFPIVFLPYLSVGKFPPRPAPSLLTPLPTDTAEGLDTDDDEARLFFVALTRARDHLVLSRAVRYGRIAARESPLLAVLKDAPGIERIRWEAGPLPFEPDGPEAPEEPDHRPTVRAADAELYLRCPRRYAYDRVEQVPTGPPSAYAAFQNAVRATLDEGLPLGVAWERHGPDGAHPHAPLYRRVAERLAATPPVSPRTQPSEERTVELRYGSVRVAADAVTDDGTLERRTFRRPPDPDDTDVLPEPRLSLLAEAAAQAGQPRPVQVRFLQNGAVLPVADRPRQRERHLDTYERALRGIALQVFPNRPTDLTDCPACPYFFLCPE